MSTQIIMKPDGNPGRAPVRWQPIAQATDATPATRDETVPHVGGVFRLLSRRRRWIYGSALLFLAIAGALCLVMTPRYKATAQIEMLKQEQGALTVAAQDEQSQAGAARTEDALNFNLSLQTAVSVLQSDALALRVIKELNLEATEDFAYKPLIWTQEKRQAASLPMDQSPKKRTYILKRWSRHLKVQSEPGTRVIDVSFSHPDPAIAAMIVNRLISDYVDYRYEVRYAAVQRSTDWLNAKLAVVKTQAQESANHLADASKAVGIYGSAESDHNIVVNRLEQLDAAAAEAQATRAAKEAVYKLAQSGDPELVTGMVGSNGQGANLSSNTAYVLNNLRQQEADLSAQYAEAATKFGPENPKLLQIKNKLQAVREEVRAETEKIVGHARQEYLAAVSAESNANRALAEEKGVAADMQQKIAAYRIAKNEADSAQSLYERLLQTARETPILAGIRSTDVNIVNAAIPPGKPASPIVPLYLAAGAFLGTLFGIAGAFIRDSVDTSLRNPEDIEVITQLPVLGVVPRGELEGQNKKRKSLDKGASKERVLELQHFDVTADPAMAIPSLYESRSLVMEAFRSVRSSILLSGLGNPRRVFMVTSAEPGEGKSFSSLHLAVALAQNSRAVLLVDADLRRGTLSRNLKMSFRNGLSTLIAGNSDSETYREIATIPNLSFLPAGATPPNPAELIGSEKMEQLIAEWRKKFDFVVIDSSPVLPVTDAAILSHVVDGVLLVVRFAFSKQQAISRAVRTLLGVRAECFGVVVNDVDTRSSEYGYYYGKNYYGSEADVIEAESGMLVASVEGK